MSTTVCLLPSGTVTYPGGAGGGHLWAHMNWALGFQAAGCRVIWLECISPDHSMEAVKTNVRRLKDRLGAAGVNAEVALCVGATTRLPAALRDVCLDVDAASEADILVNFLYALDPGIHRRFKRSALIDIDPGLLQGWIATGSLDVADHDIYFTIGEHIGRRASRTWHHTPPPVALDAWPVVRAAQTASYTTVSHWWESSWVTWDGPAYLNDKRAGFMEYADLPRRTTVPLELALYLSPGDEEERRWLEQQGWRILLAQEVSASPERYQRYIQDSRGEFSCAKPSCVRLQNAWVSDRTLCYLASGKPAVVQHTGPSRFLPEADGLFRFRDIEDAARCFEVLERDYEKQCRSARALAEEYFDGRQVARAVLDLALS